MNKRTISQQSKVEKKDLVIFINIYGLSIYKLPTLLGVGGF
jgi:hypothetical protein